MKARIVLAVMLVAVFLLPAEWHLLPAARARLRATSILWRSLLGWKGGRTLTSMQLAR